MLVYSRRMVFRKYAWKTFLKNSCMVSNQTLIAESLISRNNIQARLKHTTVNRQWNFILEFWNLMAMEFNTGILVQKRTHITFTNSHIHIEIHARRQNLFFCMAPETFMTICKCWWLLQTVKRKRVFLVWNKWQNLVWR